MTIVASTCPGAPRRTEVGTGWASTTMTGRLRKYSWQTRARNDEPPMEGLFFEELLRLYPGSMGRQMPSNRSTLEILKTGGTG